MKKITKFFIMSLAFVSALAFLTPASAHWSKGYTRHVVYTDGCCNRNVVKYKLAYRCVNCPYYDCNGCYHCRTVKQYYYHPVSRVTYYNNCNSCNSCY